MPDRHHRARSARFGRAGHAPRPLGATAGRARVAVALVAIVVLALAAVAAAVGVGAAAADGGEAVARLGGGGDLRSGTVLVVPSGGHVDAVHHLFADNPGEGWLEVELRAETPPGIVIEAEPAGRRRIPPGGRVEVPWRLVVAPGAVPGDHPVLVQLVRTDVAAAGVVTVPAVGRALVVRVTGARAQLRVRAVSDLDGAPVAGRLGVARLEPGADPVEVAAADGHALSAVVAPGTYRVSTRLGDRVLAERRVELAAEASEEVELAVATVRLTHAGVAVVRERRSVAVLEWRVAVLNRIGPVPGPVEVALIVGRDGGDDDPVSVERLEVLDSGVTEASGLWRPEQGFAPGRWQVQPALVAPSFVLVGPEPVAFTVPGPDRRWWWLAGAVVVAGALGTVAWRRRWSEPAEGWSR